MSSCQTWIFSGATYYGENITKKVDSLLKEMHLEKITHTWATTDSGSNVVKVMRLSKGINDNVWCADHQTHLNVTQALQSVPEWVVIPEKINKLVGCFNHSAKSTSILKKIDIEYKENRTTLVQRVPTRWNSDLKQLRSILNLDGCLAIILRKD